VRHSLRTLAVAAGTGALLFVAAGPASAKSISQLPASCSLGTAGHAIFMEQGSRVTLGFGASGEGAAGTWHTTIVDNETNVVLDYTSAQGPAWNISTTKELPRGRHVVAVQGDNLTTGETCTATISFKN
jgi:hypothetical protein